MTRKDRALSIIYMIKDLARIGRRIEFTDDMNGKGFTIYIDNDHYHTFSGKGDENEMLLRTHQILGEVLAEDLEYLESIEKKA